MWLMLRKLVYEIFGVCEGYMTQYLRKTRVPGESAWWCLGDAGKDRGLQCQ
jgi:hypothetical protein